jgi:biotin carboxylase/biotin carboxyl carrier protein
MLSKVVAPAVRAAVGRTTPGSQSSRVARAAAAPFANGLRHKATNPSATQVEPPYRTVLIYNQSKHACQSVLADIRAVWGNKVRVLQVIQDDGQHLPGMNGGLKIGAGMWGNMDHFGERLDWQCTQDHKLQYDRARGEAVFMPGWSAFAESAEAAHAVTDLGLVWPGTEPVASVTLEKIGFKRICKEVGAPTPAFEVLSEEDAKADLVDPVSRENCIQEFMAAMLKVGTTNPGLIKSIHGGGGKGTAHLDDPSDADQVRAAVEKVLNEMHRSDGIYFEQKVNTKGDGRFYQLELEVDGDTVAQGGRFVWFNSRLQKVVEIGLSDEFIPLFMPMDLYQKSREWSAAVAKKANNNTRATMEGLVFVNEKGEHELQFIECNRRPQVENEALALLQKDSDGHRRYTFAELMMRSKGYKPPDFQPADGINVVLHARWLHGNPDSKGDITYQAGTVYGIAGPRLDFVAAELLAPGEISFKSDPQLGKAVITAGSWNEMCDRACIYFQKRLPVVHGSSSTYAQTMYNLFSNKDFIAGKIASNETFKYLDIPEYPNRNVQNILQDQVSPVLVSGYRPGEGIDATRWPAPHVLTTLEGLQDSLSKDAPAATAFTSFSRGESSYEDYVGQLREQLAKQGGAWVTVAPRDTAQQGNDSESAGVSAISRRNAELWAQKAGCVGYEIGGAQYQAGLIRGFDPATILTLGLPYNMPGHSLQRSQYANGLAELIPAIRNPLFQATADLVTMHYRPGGKGTQRVPWQPYNFHAGNFCDPAGYSPQDLTTAELLAAGCVPMPNWVFSPHFPLEECKKWTGRQIDVFEKAGMKLQQLRIKNPGQGKDWTAEAIWSHVKTINAVFKERSLEPPIVYIHNHDFNGLGGHIGAKLFKMAQAEGFNNMVIDGAYRKNGTHNDNTVLLAGLNLTTEQNEALLEYNHLQQQIEGILARFDSRTSQMTPWDSDWAGGTEGSDIRICKEYDINPRLINHAKEVASEVFPLERAVTPFSEYKLRIGIGIMVEEAIQPKSATAVREFINKGGKLKVGGDVLVGLKRWETLMPKPDIVDKLLDNMKDELDSAMGALTKLLGPDDIPSDYTASQRHTALGYQAKGNEFVKNQKLGKDLTPLLLAPHVLHAKPRTLAAGTKFEVITDAEFPTKGRTQVEFQGFGRAPNGDITLSYLLEGQTMTVALDDPDRAVGVGAKVGPRKAQPGNPDELPCIIPGEVLSYAVKPGDVLVAGEPLCVLESMKMEMKISVPEEIDGKRVKSLPCKGRTKELQGDILAPGDLLLELEDGPSNLDIAAGSMAGATLPAYAS